MTLVNQKLHAANVLGDRMESISKFVHYRNLQPALKTAVQGHFQMVNAGYLSREALLNEKQVLSQMTPGLRSGTLMGRKRRHRSTRLIALTKGVALYSDIRRFGLNKRSQHPDTASPELTCVL